MASVRKLAALLRSTPLHPQWLLGSRRLPFAMADARGQFLDIGAADRWLEVRLPASVRYVALDYPSTGGELYRARPDVFADAAALPFAGETFDAVACLEVLEHVPDAAGVLSEIARVLKRGGRCWLSMPFLYPLHDAPFDFQRYTIFGMQRDVAAAGLTVVTTRKVDHAIRAAGLLACLAVAGGAHDQRTAVRWILLPITLIWVLVINVVAWIASHMWPDWNSMATGHEFEVRKP